jgi:heme a synthase
MNFKSKAENGLHQYAILTALVTFPLIFVGGLVTSHDVGLAVPDWPTTYGYNMFFFPWKKMVGGILLEHSHRLLGSLLGFLAIGLVVWTWFAEKERRWLRILVLMTLALIILQGVLGGYRVWLLMRPIAIVHAFLAQVVFCALAAVALFTSRWWKERAQKISGDTGSLRKWTVILVLVVGIQLILGAIMRHTNSGLAIPDFPLMYGKWMPPVDVQGLEQVNQQRIWKWDLEPVTFAQIAIHLAHRIWALLVLACVLIVFRTVWRHHWQVKSLKVWSILLLSLTVIQLCLGIFTIWTQKAADVATMHVAVGALTLMVSSLLSIISFKLLSPIQETATIPVTTSEMVT